MTTHRQSQRSASLITGFSRAKRIAKPTANVMFLLLLPLTGCSGADGQMTDGGMTDSELGVVENELVAEHEGTSECSPYTQGLIDYTSRMVRIVTNSNAFKRCVSQRMDANYEGCGQDPGSEDPRSLQLALAWNALEFENNLRYTCSYSTAADPAESTAPDQIYGDYGTKVIDLADDWSESFPGWSGYSGIEPVDSRAMGIVHQFMHAHGYNHWKDGCPAGYDGATNSVPYIYGQCVQDVINASYTTCSRFDDLDTDGLALVSTWPPTSSCKVVSDLQHRFALRTYDGHMLRAIDGGGSDVDAIANGQGPYETFFFIDANRGRLMSGDVVHIKTLSGRYLRVGTALHATGSSSRLHSTYLWAEKVGGGEIVAGSQIRLRTYDYKYVRAEGGGGGSVTVNPVTPSVWETFRVEAPRRQHVVRLRAESTDRFVNVGSDGMGYVNAPRADDEDQAFWILDHNGGDLLDGDLVSFETLHSSHFMSTCSSGTGHVSLSANYTSSCSTFRIVKLGGSSGSGIAHDDEIALRSSNSRYLMGIPNISGYRYQLWNYSKDITALHRFRVDMVQGERWVVR